MRKLKLFFACLLMAVLSIGQMWAVDQSFAFSTIGSTGWTNSYADHSITCTDGTVSMKASKQTGTITDYPVTKGQPVSFVLSDNTKSLSAVSFTCQKWGSKAQTITLKYSTDGGDSYSDLSPSVTSTNFSISSSSLPTGTNAVQITFNSQNNQVGIQSMSYTLAGGSSDPTVSADPTSVSVEAADVENQSVTLTASNFASSISSATTGLYSDAECNTAITSGEWVKNITVNAAKTAVTFDVDDNDGAQRQCWLKITLGDGTSTASAILPITQAKYSAPTGTFALYSGNITEGDYVIYYSGKAMNTTVTSNRLQYAEVTPSNDKITNPDASIIWHIAASGDYWTLYNEADEKYAAATGTKSQAQMLASGTDDKSLWSVTGTSTYEFVNKNNSASEVNANLRNNGTYGFACYATGTGGALTLYKKDDGKPSAPTFSPAAGSFLEAQNVTISTLTDGATIYYTTDGSTPTTSSSAFSSAIPVSATTTIKAIAVKDAVSSSVASATFTITTPLTIAQAVALVPNVNDAENDQFVEGYVCTAGTSVSSGQMSYYISADGKDDGVVEHKLQIYKGKNLNNTDFSATSDLAVGDKVVVYGQLLHYNASTYEMNSGNYIARYTAKGDLTTVAVSGTPTKTVYANGDAFEPAGLVVTATYANGYAVDVTDEVTANEDWAASPATITASGDVAVTATYGGMTSAAYNVAVEKASKTLVSISLSSLSEEESQVWQGLELPKPTVTAHYTEGEDEDVTALATFTGYDNTTPGEQTITVSYSLGESDSKTYTVTVKSIYNVELAASVARNLIVNVVGNTESTDDMIVRGKVSYINNASSNAQTYWISDDGTRTNEVEIFKGKYLSGADFTSANQLKVGDEVVVVGKVIYYNNTTPEFANGKSEVQSLARTPNFEIADVAEFEVGAADLAVADLTITQDGEGAVTLASSDDEDVVTIVDGKLRAVAAGTATITANLAANGIYKAATYEFSVTVIAAQVKYAITFDGNGADGGSAPEAIADKAAGAPVTLPANAYTKTGYTFDHWKVFYVDGESVEHEVAVSEGAFTMPAFAVTIQAQWTEIPVWAYTYTSNVTIASNESKKVIISEVEYDAAKTNKGTAATITLPQGVTKIHMHLVAWNGDANSVVTVTGACFDDAIELTLADNANVSGSSNYDLGTDATMYYFSLTPDNAVAADEVITISAASGKRFVLFGVNQEGGVVPVLDHIAISGTMTNTTGWKTGDEITPEGLTVNAYYTLNDVLQDDPVDVTSSVTWSHAALVENQTEVTLTATYTEGEVQKTANTNVTIEAVETGESIISTDANNRYWTVDKDATADNKTFTVTLKNVAAATATLGGTNPEAFNIDKTALVDGDVITVSVVSTATVGVYTATITISDDANVAEDKVVNVSLTVNEPEVEETAVSTSSEWVAATAADLVDGAEVLITGVKDEVTYAMGADRGNNRFAVAGTLNEGVFTPGENTMSFTLVAQGDGTFAIRTSNGKYLYAGGTGNSNYLNTKAYAGELDANAKWNITISSIIATSTNRNDMRFNYNNNNPALISCYQSTATYPAVALYVPYVEPTPEPVYETVRENLTPNAYYTMCLDKAVTAVQGGTIWRVLSKAQNTSDIILEEITGTLDAGRPYIFFATADKLEVVYEGAAVGAPITTGNNGLIGSFTQELIAQAATNYIIYNNELYFVNSANVYVGAHRAYLDMTEVPAYSNEPQQGAPRRRVTMAVHGPQVATGIDALNASDAPVKVLINGQLFIIRGEKMFDAKGQLVK